MEGVLFSLNLWYKGGMDFKDKVHKVVKKIPEGETFGYKDVAKRVGVPRAWRAVGSVLRKNYKIPRSLASRG